MPVRIYALAKELKMDSKELVDACTRAGVTGKGSALASLTDDEAKKVRDYLGGKTSKPAPPAAPSNPTAAAATTPKAAAAPPKPSTVDRAITRDDYVAPGGTVGGGKPKVLGNKPSGDKDRKADRKSDDDKPKPPQKQEPVIKLAAMPEAVAPTVPASNPNDPPAQKPIMTLPKDAIRGAKEGTSAPLKQFTRQQETTRRGGSAPGTPAGGAPKVVPGSPDDAGKGRGKGRRGKLEKEGTQETDGKPKGKGSLAGMASTRQSRQSGRRRGFQGDSGMRRRPRRLVRRGTNTAAPRKSDLVVELPCTIRSFSEVTGIPAVGILRSLMALNTPVSNINAELDPELAEMLAAEAEVDVVFKYPESLEDSLLSEMEDREDDDADLVTRPPIVTFLGHVDHGKTSLLDGLIGIDVVSGEAGGITQHIRAYSIEKDGRTISFVDTPGHEAFTEMRARGANVTDIAVLVVAADDGVMPQTEEAISHARAAEVPIVVALNKIDLPGVDENKALQGLSTHELLPTEWGGDIEVVKTSATTGAGMDDLLETLLLTADLHEYKANPKRAAIGTCLEAQQEGGRGVVAKMIVQNGLCESAMWWCAAAATVA